MEIKYVINLNYLEFNPFSLISPVFIVYGPAKPVKNLNQFCYLLFIDDSKCLLFSSSI